MRKRKYVKYVRSFLNSGWGRDSCGGGWGDGWGYGSLDNEGCGYGDGWGGQGDGWGSYWGDGDGYGDGWGYGNKWGIGWSYGGDGEGRPPHSEVYETYGLCDTHTH